MWLSLALTLKYILVLRIARLNTKNRFLCYPKIKKVDRSKEWRKCFTIGNYRYPQKKMDDFIQKEWANSKEQPIGLLWQTRSMKMVLM